MGIIKKQAIVNTVITYAGLMLGAVNILWLMPKGLSPQEVGLRSLLLSSAFLISPLARIGFNKVIIKFYPKFKNSDKKDHGFLFIILIIPFAGFLLITLLFLIFKQPIFSLFEAKSAIVKDYLWYMIPITFFVMYMGILSSYCQVNYKITVPAFIRQVVMQVLTAILLILMNAALINFREFVSLMVLIYFIGVLLHLLYLRYLNLLFLRPDYKLINKPMVKEIMTYGLFVILGGVGAVVSANIGILMLGAMIGLHSAAIFSISYYLGNIIDVPRNALSRIASPYIAESWHKGKTDLIDSLYKKSAINQMIVGILIFLIIWLNIDAVFSLMPKGAIYASGKWVVFFVGLAKVVDMSTGINTEILINSEKYKFNFILVISFTLLVILLNYFLIPKYALMGASIAIFASFVYFNLAKFLYLYFEFKMQPFSLNFLKVLFSGIFVFFVFTFLPHLNGVWADLVLRTASVFLLYIALIAVTKPSEEINYYLVKVRKIFSRT
ncbi:MAG: oligosaccharide flippase family protein [Bacteroidota bacterium]